MTRFFLIFGLIVTLFPVNLLAYSYGPACQWIHLVGGVERPPELEGEGPILLSVTYQFDEMKQPATLLTNYPLAKDQFRFFFAGFTENLPNTLLVPPMFFFAKEITFQYYAKTRDGKWRSPFQKSVFRPPQIPKVDIPAHRNQEYRCHTGIQLKPIALQRQR